VLDGPHLSLDEALSPIRIESPDTNDRVLIQALLGSSTWATRSDLLVHGVAINVDLTGAPLVSILLVIPCGILQV
jgi:hypothetical protein